HLCGSQAHSASWRPMNENAAEYPSLSFQRRGQLMVQNSYDPSEPLIAPLRAFGRSGNTERGLSKSLVVLEDLFLV
ncbi:hypothetical protein A2U01_0058470, partial [Trifolium medium]|nr:hypothetical protein [Trifolium medium]